MPKILPHEKLGMSFAELGAMLGARALLASQTVQPRGGWGADDDEAHTFDMAITCRARGDCGSVSCIGGTMGLILFNGDHDKAADYVSDSEVGGNPRLTKLFFPFKINTFWWDIIQPKEAVAAIDNCLAGKNDPWTPDLIKRIKKRIKAINRKRKKANEEIEF